ncbi:hypothetical protein LBMAG42_14450 [Deltaproteobacteria bacterium]|nr:hypothetical protein LBMAG42_14450 [Deltaproteobacteria bacterium]
MSILFLWSFLACPATTDSADPEDTGADADTAGDTANDTDSGDTEETGTADPETLNAVVTTFLTADRGEGFDLDGDGEVDNALWPVGGMLDPMIAEALLAAQHVAIAQLSGVDDRVADSEIRVGVFTAVDADADGSDNGTGAESFDAGEQIDATGLALVGADTELVAGSYEVEVATGSLPVGSYTLELATGLHLASTLDDRGQAGMLGFGISVTALRVALEAESASPEVVAAIEALADLDLDGDGTADAVSMAFTFEAVFCQLDAPLP